VAQGQLLHTHLKLQHLLWQEQNGMPLDVLPSSRNNSPE
jgi:hypothetical protein